MKRWRPIATAPHDGRLVHVKRVHDRRLVAEGEAYFGDVTVDYGDDIVGPQLQTHRNVWVAADGIHLFPTPTHFLEPGDD